MAKIGIQRIFDVGRILTSFQKSGIDGEDFITYVSELATTLVSALQGKLTLEENLNSEILEVTLQDVTSQTVLIKDKRKTPKHVFPTKSTPFSSRIQSFNWQIIGNGDIQVIADFNSVPSNGKVTVQLVILY